MYLETNDIRAATQRAVKTNGFLHKQCTLFYYDFQHKFVTIALSKVLFVRTVRNEGTCKTFKVLAIFGRVCLCMDDARIYLLLRVGGPFVMGIIKT